MIQPETTKDTKGSADRLSYDIVGAAIEVHRRLGPGLLVIGWIWSLGAWLSSK
jgi:hypothetical protein